MRERDRMRESEGERDALWQGRKLRGSESDRRLLLAESGEREGVEDYIENAL